MLKKNKNMIINGDCLEELKKMDENSIDAIVSDPPAGIAFMGKDWDTDKGGRDKWIEWMQEISSECLRVIKPGGHTLIWSIPRTSHWTSTAWENAGFEIRDVIAHIFGSGFPKNHNIGIAVDKIQGNGKEKVGETKIGKTSMGDATGWDTSDNMKAIKESGKVNITKGTSEWEGWGTALKPAREDWILMRKPIEKGLTIAENCLKWSVGGLNIDKCRVGTDGAKTNSNGKRSMYGGNSLLESKTHNNTTIEHNYGRYPANLTHDGSDEVVSLFPDTKSGKMGNWNTRHTDGSPNGIYGKFDINHELGETYGDSGSASRFFKQCESTEEAYRIKYQSKPSKRERNAGCEGLEEKQTWASQDKREANSFDVFESDGRPKTINKNNHPTVKAIALMEYLVKLISREGATVLDPFMGSGSTGIACTNLKRKFIGIEMDSEYCKIAKVRIKHAKSEIESKLF